jgi:acetyltransferase
VVLARLTAAGVACVDTLVVDPPTLGAVRLAAEDLGFPVVLKLEHHDLLHKTDAGGVVVDIRSVDELAAACAKLRAVAAAATLEGFRLVVQRMVSGVEVIVGAKRDESFGHVLVVGAGGTHAELINDVRLALLPVDANRVSRLIRENSRLMRLLSGYRGTAAVDLNALERQILAIADWIVGQGDAILEFDANPVIVTRDRALVVDARAVFAERSVP